MAQGEQAVNVLFRETKRAQIEAARRDPRAFNEYAFGLRQEKFQDEWQYAFDNEKRVVVVAPRAHGKSTQVIGRIIWSLGKNPNLRLKLICASDGKASERIQEIREHIEKNARVREVFPGLVPNDGLDWTKRKITLKRSIISKDVSLEALGVGSSATGGRADGLIFDDACDERNTLRLPELRGQVKRTFYSVYVPMLEPSGFIWYICTLWHAADLSHELLANGRYVCHCHEEKNDAHANELPWAVVQHDVGTESDPTKPLWAKRGRTYLRKNLKIMGMVEYNRAFRNIALAGGATVIDADWIVYEQPPDEGQLLTFNAYDLSKGENVASDYFACCRIGVPKEWPPEEGSEVYDTAVAGGMDPDDWGPLPVWVLDAWHGRLSFGAQVRTIIGEWETFGAEYIGVESTALEGVTSQLEREPGAPTTLPLLRLKPVKGKGQRLMQVSPLVETARVRFAPHLNPARGTLGERGDLVGELTLFPVAKHDDMMDAFVYCLFLLMRWERSGGRGRKRVEAAVGVRVF